MHLVERDDVDGRAPQLAADLVQKLRRDFQKPVWLETVGTRRAHMMQRQDHAHAADKRPHQHMRAAEIQRLHPGPDYTLLQAQLAPHSRVTEPQGYFTARTKLGQRIESRLNS